jgi:hypothetical protein
MAQLDASIAEPNATTSLAFRADAYRLAVLLLKEAGLLGGEDAPSDVLYVAQFLTAGTTETE